MEQLLTSDQVAKNLAVSERTVQRLMEEGKLAYIKVGRQRRVHPQDLEACVQQYRSGGAATAAATDGQSAPSRGDAIVEAVRCRRQVNS